MTIQLRVARHVILGACLAMAVGLPASAEAQNVGMTFQSLNTDHPGDSISIVVHSTAIQITGAIRLQGFDRPAGRLEIRGDTLTLILTHFALMPLRMSSSGLRTWEAFIGPLNRVRPLRLRIELEGDSERRVLQETTIPSY